MLTSNLMLSAPMRHLGRGVFCAAAVALAGAACPVIAVAEPVWDIEEYDYCLRQTGSMPPGSDPVAKEEENDRYCCYRSGGVWNGLTCVTPAAEGEGAAIPPSGPKAGLPTVQVRPPIVAPPGPPVNPPVIAPSPPLLLPKVA